MRILRAYCLYNFHMYHTMAAIVIMLYITSPVLTYNGNLYLWITFLQFPLAFPISDKHTSDLFSNLCFQKSRISLYRLISAFLLIDLAWMARLITCKKHHGYAWARSLSITKLITMKDENTSCGGLFTTYICPVSVRRCQFLFPLTFSPLLKTLHWSYQTYFFWQ